MVMLITNNIIVNGAIDCMDNSYHLAKKCDNKSYHYVPCNCPCKKQLSAVRNKCISCGHYHEGKQWKLISTAQINNQFKTGKTKSYQEDIRSVLTKFIVKQRKEIVMSK